MNRRLTAKILIIAWTAISITAAAIAADSIALPPPQKTGGKPLMDVLAARQSTREFADKPIPDQLLANLLWAACGINREDEAKRTAPSAMNWQEVDVYVIRADGAFRYDAKANALQNVVEGDIRELAGRQPFVKTAPINLIFVADRAKMGPKTTNEDKAFYAAADTGYISQNVYLFCASEGLGTVVRGWVDRDALAKKLGLKKDQVITLAQTIAYPAK